MSGQRICPVSHARGLEGWFRRMIHSPRRIIEPYISPGDTVLDIGCGPGYFTCHMARLVGGTGRVIAVDVQEGMLQLLRQKAEREGLLDIIIIRQAAPGSLGLSMPGKIDFALAFYVVHEVPDAARLFREVADLLSDGGRLLVVEPGFHVSDPAFGETVRHARSAGLSVAGEPKILLSRAVLLEKKGR
ncbi:MAG: class I SAM-dependent methyltransferase [Methanoculleaceae archaeon]